MAKDTFFSKTKSLNCNGRLVFLEHPIIMGILNLTPDSFYDGGKLSGEKLILQKAEQFLKEGATILDIGGYSSRPGADNISEKEELKRILPAIKSISKYFPEAIISIDTFRSEIAKEAISTGASIINDISAGNIDNKMHDVVSELQVPYIVMHMQGTPSTMQKNPSYNNVLAEVSHYFSKKINRLTLLGVNDIILDPGFGFGKTIEHNYNLLNNLNQLKVFNKPLLVGISRKSMIYKVLQTSPEEALNSTSALHAIALLKGANILRVHDVKEAAEVVKIVTQLKIS